MDESHAADGTHAAASLDITIGKLDADRLCQRCLHQMHGAIVYKDRRLEIAYTRCTECGHAAPVTEYPHSWRWLRRFGLAIAMIMLLAATGLLVADVAASSMIGYGSAWEVSRPFGDAMQVIGTTIDANANWWVSEKVMAERAMLDGALSDATAIDRAEADFLVMMIPSGIIAAVGATLWSVVLFHRGRRWALAFQVIPLGLGLLFGGLAVYSEMPSTGSNWSYHSLALSDVGWRVLLLIAAWMAVVRCVAVLVARPLLSGFLRLVVPSRVRRGVESLWNEDRVQA
jgi:ferredoxin-like protein FixX